MKLLALFVLIALAVTIARANRCRPGLTYKVDCNTCYCFDDKVPYCTLYRCSPNDPWGPLYVQGTPCPAKKFYSECNGCICGDDGISAVCTKKLCRP